MYIVPLGYSGLLWYWTSMLWSIEKTRYLLTSITWPYCRLKFRAYWSHMFFFLSRLLTKHWFLIWTRAHVRLNCCKQGWVVRKPVNANPGLKVNLSIIFLLYNVFHCFCFEYFEDLEIFHTQHWRPNNINRKPCKVTKQLAINQTTEKMIRHHTRFIIRFH